MRIVGHGIDIVETARIEHLLNAHGQRFLQRCFTEQEQLIAAEYRGQVEHLAGRFAAKEAILKVLGTGWRNGIAWTDMQIVPEASGQPQVELGGKCLQLSRQLRIDQWLITISHIKTHAVASAIGVAGGMD